MSNEEFQKVILAELESIKNDIRDLKEGQKRLEGSQKSLEEGQKRLESSQRSLEEGQKRLEDRQGKLEERMGKLEDRQEKFEKKLDAVYEQTAQLIEFRNEVNLKLDNILEDNKSIHEILGEHEVSIRTLRRKPV